MKLTLTEKRQVVVWFFYEFFSLKDIRRKIRKEFDVNPKSVEDPEDICRDYMNNKFQLKAKGGKMTPAHSSEHTCCFCTPGVGINELKCCKCGEKQ